MYRPSFINPENMKALGYSLVKEEGGILTYTNNGGVEFPHYGPAAKGKRYIYFNTTFKDKLFLGIKEDGGTRTVFHGFITEISDFLTINKLVA